MKAFIKLHYSRIKTLYKRYERILMPAMLIGGFMMEYIKFIHIPISATFILLFAYWLLAGAIIFFIHIYDNHKISHKLRYIRLFSPLIIQFSFGALLGASLIFYWLAGDFSISWPIMIVLVLLMVFNETFRHWFERPVVQVGVYFFATFSLFSELLPYVFSSLSAWLFVVAGLLSLVIFGVYIQCLCIFATQVAAQKRQFFLVIIAIAAAMNVLYFTNIIPPIPLALHEAGLYHSIKNSNGKYIMTGESENFFQKILFGQTLHVKSIDRVYLYTAIFAPENLKTTIVDHWQYYNEKQKAWIDKGNLSLNINGGLEDGYKGYSWQSNLTEGKWRVFVQSQRGQVLAKIQFMVVRPTEEVKLQETVR